jgi:sterol desaturase/sphingolipid hydroxylase (fatty acid hydroxylase superfamily)
MTHWLTEHELTLRGGAFIAVLLAMALWEVLAPRRRLTASKPVRWANNLALVALDTALVRVLFPAGAMGVAAFASAQGWGVLHLLELPAWVEGLIAVVALDFTIWLQHVMVHAVPALWRLHRVHHADPDYDLTTGARFHPLEILLSMLIKFAAIVVIGPSVLAVIVFEVVLNATAMFNHGNVRLPLALDRILRLFVVTPDMHRVHHSVEDDEANSNFGFNLPWWDLLFGTYRDQPRNGHTGMRIGIRDYTQPREVSWLPGMLLLPFRGRINRYAINRRPWTTRESANDQ